MKKELFLKRFNELADQSKALPFVRNDGYEGAHVPAGKWEQWATSVQSLIKAVFSQSSPHYENFTSAFQRCRGYDYEVKVLQGIFDSAKEDYEGGYVFNLELRVSGEVFGDFVVMAREALGNGHKDVAAVLACAALEDTLKRFAEANDLDVSEKTMAEVVNALKSKGLVLGAQKSLLDAMPRIRNLAMHASWDKISEPDVSSVIGFVEQFLLSKFSNG